MPKLDNTGPKGKGAETGRKLGFCRENSKEDLLQKLGTGLGLRRKSGGGRGKGKRLKSNVI
jgi:hypothetical protein